MPPQEAVYQFQLAPIPNVPPEILKADEFPWQIIAGEAFAEVGLMEIVVTVIVALTHEVVLHTFSALAQYVVVETGLSTGAAPEMA